MFHPDSKWQEPLGDNDLTLYEIQRKPRTIAVDPNQRMRLPVKILHPEFRCPICLMYMRNTSVVMECMHRFCERCITDSIRRGKNECPTCRIHIPSRRSLRKDERMDEIIQCILGDPKKQDDAEDEQIELLKKSARAAKQQNSGAQRAASRGASVVKKRETRNSTKREAASMVPATPIQGFEVSLDFLSECLL